LANLMQVKIFKSVDDIGKDSFDFLSNDGFYTYGWFKTVETTSAFKLDPFYVTVFEGGKLAGFAPCFLDLEDTYFFRWRGPKVVPLMKKILSVGSAGRLWQPHALLCYSPMCYRSKVLVGKGYEGKEILNQLSKGIDFVCRRERILFSSFLLVPEHDRLLMSDLENLGYQRFPWDDTLFLDIQWVSFDKYLESLRGHTRKNVKREIKMFVESGMKIELISEFGELAETLSNLRDNLIWKWNRIRSPYDEVFYRRLNEFARDKIRLFVVKKNGEVVGFCCCFQEGATLDISHCGFNYEVLGNSDFAYFNVTYYAPIRWAIENSIEKIFCASEHPELKKRRGFKPESVFSFVKCYNRALSVYAVLLNRYIQTPSLRTRTKNTLLR
jgi:predicted N-acyltransferase